MGEDRTTYVKRNIRWSICSNLLSVILQFILRTLFLRYLSSEYLGLNSFCTSILGVLNLSCLGVDTGLAFHLYEPIAKNDNKRIQMLLGFYQKVFFYFGCFIIGIGLLLLPFISRLIKCDIPNDTNIYIVFLSYVLNAALSYLLNGHLSLFIDAFQCSYYSHRLLFVSFLIQYSIQIIAICNRNYYLSVLVMPFTTTLFGISRNIIVKRKFREYLDYDILPAEDRKLICRRILSLLVFKIRDMSRNSFDGIIVSYYLGLSILSDYQNYVLVLSVPILLRTLVCGAILPSLGNLVVVENIERTKQIFYLICYWMLFLSGWFAICYGCLIQDFVRLWIGDEYLLDNSVVLLLVFQFYFLGYCNLSTILREAFGKWEKGRVSAVSEMLINFVLNIVFAKTFGVTGIVFATVISVVVVNVPFEMRPLLVNIFRNRLQDGKNVFVIAFFESVIVGGVTYLVCEKIGYFSIWRFILKCLFCLVGPSSVFILLHRRDKEVRDILVSLFNR